jgi:hypothetical protein
MRLLAIVVCVPGLVFGYEMGVIEKSGQGGSNCNSCHSGGAAPTVRISGPATLAAGSTGDFTFSITGGPGVRSGMNISVDAPEAQLIGVAGSTKTLARELIQDGGAKTFTGSTSTYTFRMKAPSTAGTVTLYACGNSTNGNGSTGGDKASNTTFQVTVTSTSNAPRFTTEARADVEPVTTASVGVRANATSAQGESGLIYTWSTVSGPGTVQFTPNASNAAKQSNAVFDKAGQYELQVSVSDASGQSTVSRVRTTVSATLTSLAVTPKEAEVVPGGTLQFAAQGQDQFAQAMAVSSPITWAVMSGGTISSTGLFTAGQTLGGPHQVQAAVGSKLGATSLRVVTQVSANTTPPAVAAPTDSDSSAQPGCTSTGVGLCGWLMLLALRRRNSRGSMAK